MGAGRSQESEEPRRDNSPSFPLFFLSTVLFAVPARQFPGSWWSISHTPAYANFKNWINDAEGTKDFTHSFVLNTFRRANLCSTRKFLGFECYVLHWLRPKLFRLLIMYLRWPWAKSVDCLSALLYWWYLRTSFVMGGNFPKGKSYWNSSTESHGHLGYIYKIAR